MNEEEYNQKIIGWALRNLASVKNTISALGIKHYPYSRNKLPLKSNIRFKVFRRDGKIYRIGFSMPKSAVFEHKGVGRGHKANNPRKAKRFFDIPTEINMPDLRDIVADQDATYVINNLTIK